MDIDFGQILPDPTDVAYNSSTTYSAMQTCLDEYKSEWLSLVDGNRGHALPGYYADGTAKVSDYWRCIVNVYRTGAAANEAVEKAQLAQEKANLANSAAGNANEKATLAETQAAYAKNMADHPSYIGEDNYYYRWDYAQQKYIKGSYMKGSDLNFSTMTEEEKQELFDGVTEIVEREGGFVLYPVDLSQVTTTTVFQKNSIICIDGVVYKSKQQTSDFPVVLLVENNKFVTQVISGTTVFVKPVNTLSSDWEVWLDASSDFRYKQLEARVARLETITA